MTRRRRSWEPGVIDTRIRDRGLRWKSVFGAAAVVAIAIIGVTVEMRTDVGRRGALDASLQAEGLGHVRIEREWGPRCGLAAGAYRWMAGAASGTACVGPVDRVSIRRGTGQASDGATR